jgi:hypothetical protein
MADPWYCWVAGGQTGPFSDAQLRTLVAEGRLLPEDQVRQGHYGQWVPAREVKGLFSGVGASPVSPGPAQGPNEPAVRSRQRPILRAKPVESPGQREQPKEPTRSGSPPPPPIPPGARHSAAPPAPEPSVAAPVEGLGFLEAEYATPPPSAVLGQTPRADPFSHMKNPKILLWILLGLLGFLAVLVIALFIFKGEGSKLREGRIADESAKRAAQEEKAGKKGAPDAASKKSKPDKPAEVGPVQWIDASRDPWDGGDVTVRVSRAEIARPRVSAASGAVSLAKEPMLIVRLQLTNRASTASVKYTGWAGPNAAVKLTDASGKEYPATAFGPGNWVEGQQRAATSIGPRASIQDVLVFARPAEGAGQLRLTLPGGAVSDPGSAHFEIPKAMITAVSSSTPPSPKAEPAKPRPGPAEAPLPGPRVPVRNSGDGPPTGDPAKDFGIKGVEEEPRPDAKPPAATPP